MSREQQLCLGSLAAILRPRAGFLPYLGNSALNWVKTALTTVTVTTVTVQCLFPYAQASILALLGSA